LTGQPSASAFTIQAPERWTIQARPGEFSRSALPCPFPLCFQSNFPGRTALNSFLLVFPTVALAELGDKTQLLVMLLAARFARPWPILAGIVVGATANAGLAVAGGSLLDQVMPTEVLHWLVVVGFIAIGLWMLRESEDDEEAQTSPISNRGAFLATVWLFFVMEMGDKTQLATVALAAGLPDPGWVLAGAALGLVAANLPALWLGHRFADHLPRRLLHRIGAVVFISLGFGTLIWRLVTSS